MVPVPTNSVRFARCNRLTALFYFFGAKTAGILTWLASALIARLQSITGLFRRRALGDNNTVAYSNPRTNIC